MDDPILKQHYRQRRWQIYVPMLVAIGILLVMSVVLIVFALNGTWSSTQVEVVAACLVVPFVLLPVVLIFLVFDALMVALVFGVAMPYKYVRQGMEKLRDYSAQGLTLTQQTAERISAPLIDARTSTAKWRYRILAPLGLVEEKDEQSEKQP